MPCMEGGGRRAEGRQSGGSIIPGASENDAGGGAKGATAGQMPGAIKVALKEFREAEKARHEARRQAQAEQERRRLAATNEEFLCGKAFAQNFLENGGMQQLIGLLAAEIKSNGPQACLLIHRGSVGHKKTMDLTLTDFERGVASTLKEKFADHPEIRVSACLTERGVVIDGSSTAYTYELITIHLGSLPGTWTRDVSHLLASESEFKRSLIRLKNMLFRFLHFYSELFSSPGRFDSSLNSSRL